jgi:hypothetical protein
MKIHIQFKINILQLRYAVLLITSYIQLEYFTEFGIQHEAVL